MACFVLNIRTGLRIWTIVGECVGFLREYVHLLTRCVVFNKKYVFFEIFLVGLQRMGSNLAILRQKLMLMCSSNSLEGTR